MTDWFDPLGMRRVADAMSTGAAKTMVGRTVRLDRHAIDGRVAAVHRAAPANSLTAMLSGQIGLWRNLDIEFGDVHIGDRTVARLRIDASDVHAVDALPQRLRARDIRLDAQIEPDEVAAWLDELAPEGVTLRTVEGRLLARLPGLARFGEIELEPWSNGRTVGVHARHAWVRERRVGLPERFQRTHDTEVAWLPESASVDTIDFDTDGGVRITGRIDQYAVPLDVPRLMADLTTRGTAGVVEVLLGPE